MATEVLAVPEERLAEVIAVLRAGLDATAENTTISEATRHGLATWCDAEESYLADLADDADGAG